MARRVMAMMPGVPRMTRHEASTRGPWNGQKRGLGRLVARCAPLAMPRKKDRSLITRSHRDRGGACDYAKAIAGVNTTRGRVDCIPRFRSTRAIKSPSCRLQRERERERENLLTLRNLQEPRAAAADTSRAARD